MSVAMFWTIATVMVVAATAVIVVPMVWLRRSGEPAKLTGSTLAMALGGTILIPLAALGVYSLIGSPSMLGSPGTAISAANDGAHPGARPLQPGDASTDLGAATARLEAKLTHNPSDASGWRLLAQSYEPGTISPEDYAAMIDRELALWGAVVRETGVRIKS